jgi:hypothetical protein
MIWRNSDEEHVHEPMTLCIFRMHQMQVVHEKDPLNSKPIRKIVDKGEETTNKANGIQDTARIPMCE